MTTPHKLPARAMMLSIICSTPFLLSSQTIRASESTTPREPSTKGFRITEPTPEMLKMSPAELFKIVDLDGSGEISYEETAEALEQSPKHGPRKFAKSDRDKSGGLNLKEFEHRLTITEWWKLSRQTPKAMFKAADIDANGTLSKEEFAIFQGKKAHLNTFFKRADTNASGDLDFNEASTHLDQEIYPSKKPKNIKKANREANTEEETAQ